MNKNLKHLNEWDIFDKDNTASLNSWMKKGPKKSYLIRVKDPFVFKTDDSEEFYKMRYLLMLAGAKYTEDILEPSVFPGMAVKEGLNQTNENTLPRPYKKVKCLECGEEVCDNLNYKIGHLYNKHNCKPSVGDYKAKQMLTKYFK